MSVDFKAIADAIATQFSSTNVTAPSGETNIRLATASLPDAFNVEPAVLVFPPESVDFNFGPSLRTGLASYPVRFYIYKFRDNKRNTVLLNKWLSALYAQLPDTLAHLGLSSYVTSATTSHMAVGPMTYANSEYHGIEVTIQVRLGEGLSATA